MPISGKFRILVVDDDVRQCQMLCSYLESRGLEAVSASCAAEALELLASKGADLLVSDIRMPVRSGFELLSEMRAHGFKQPVVFITAYPDIRDAVSAMRDGAVDYLEKPVDLNEMLDSIMRNLGQADGCCTEVPDLLPPIPGNVVLKNDLMLALARDVALIAASDVNVLVTGESGSGKEVMADLIYRWSGRSGKPFLKLNCAAVPPHLLESELFGHEKGAFTGATGKRVGFFEQADGGTVLLDEISEMPPQLQAKLLRVAHDGSIAPLGGVGERRVDVRIIAATNKDMEAEVDAKRFREDLYYRLNTFEIYVPPLRERRDEIIPLARQFCSGRVRFGERASAMLLSYDWPGNIRELHNVVRRAVLLAAGSDMITEEHLPANIKGREVSNIVEKGEGVIDQVERMLILQALERNNLNRSRAAKDLKMSRRTLTYKIARLREAGVKV
ncbi:MAG: sigma-54-dependent Fis family transcriptional regulator [Victivallales bacterium]|nr:sigma-54-dependent Fis family transcriptional regulator [Victivallales bacterium]